MLSKKHFGYGAALALLCAVFFTGCASTSAAAKPEAGKGLAAWKGEWQSFSAISGASQLNEAYRTQAEKMPYYTEDGLKTMVSKMLATAIVKVAFDGSDTVAFTVLDKDGKEQKLSCTYRAVGTAPIKGFEKAMWYTFEAVEQVPGLSDARYFIAVPPHRDDGDGLLHWHVRFGGKDIESLVNADPLWWPTYVDAAFTKEELVKMFTPLIPELAGMLPKASLAAYNGKWINSSLIYDDPRPAVQSAYTQLIKEFSGKKDGEDFTKEEIIMLAKKSYGNASDFTHLEFITGDEKNELVVWKGNKEVSRTTYSRDGANELRATANAFTSADRQKAGKFAFLSMTTPHGKPAHMHVWYGMKPSEITNTDGPKPTCIPADASEDLVAARVMSTGRKLLQSTLKK